MVLLANSTKCLRKNNMNSIQGLPKTIEEEDVLACITLRPNPDKVVTKEKTTSIYHSL